MNIQPTRKEIKEYMQSYNADEVGLENPIDMEQAETLLLNDDKYHYLREALKLSIKVSQMTSSSSSRLSTSKCSFFVIEQEQIPNHHTTQKCRTIKLRRNRTLYLLNLIPKCVLIYYY